MENSNKFFLARSGKIAGPYSEEDIHTLEKRGDLLAYAWIWTPGVNDWKALDPKPTRTPSYEAPVGAHATEAYAMWGDRAIRGRVEARTELGFELIYTEKRMLPPLASGMSLQVMDLSDGTVLSRLALMKIAQIERKDGDWVIFLRHQNS